MTDLTPVPYFPQDLENYAPWVAKYGLLAPYGFCQCCCGQQVPISPITRSERDIKANHPIRFISGHNRQKPAIYVAPQLCECGCGKYTNIIKGKPSRYIKGHHKPGSRYASIADAFWHHCVPITGEECWEWNGAFFKSGYGSLSYHSKSHLAHRVSYEIHKGPIPEGMHILHSCDNRKCTNPAHLRVGTQADNVDDMISRGRNRPPQDRQAGRAKISDADAIQIRKLCSDGLAFKEIADRYGLSKSAIKKIHYRETWKHIP